MPARRAEVISIDKLSKAIDKAVTIALKRHPVTPERVNTAFNWGGIIGRKLREFKDMNEAFALATTISKGVRQQGINVTPACCAVDGDILIGFVERVAALKQLGR
jgi:hypothetical protein